MTVSLRTTSGVILAATFAWLLAGCASRGTTPSPTQEDKISRAKYLELQIRRENSLNTTWKGKNFDQLRQQLGEPPLLMNVIGFRPNKTSLVVYADTPNEAHCVDAFTMVKVESSGEWLVADYFCR